MIFFGAFLDFGAGRLSPFEDLDVDEDVAAFEGGGNEKDDFLEGGGSLASRDELALGAD